MNRFNLVLGQAIPRAAAPKVSGTMEVIAPEDGFVLETRLLLSRHSNLGLTDAMKEQKNRQNGRLHVFGPKESVVIEPIQTVPRMHASYGPMRPMERKNMGSMGCGYESSSRSYTPTKQILLRAPKSSLVKRNALTKIVKNKNSKTCVRLHERIEEEDAEIHNDEQLKTVLPKLNHETKISEAKTESDVIDEKEKESLNIEKASSSEVWTVAQGERTDKQNADEKPSDSSGDDDSEQDNNVQKQIAPLELMGEDACVLWSDASYGAKDTFLKAIMEQKYSLAKKLCQMILIYEPENPEAKQFLPLIEHKLLLEKKQHDEEDEETGEGSSEDSEEDTSSTDNNETDSEASSKDSSDND